MVDWAYVSGPADDGGPCGSTELGGGTSAKPNSRMCKFCGKVGLHWKYSGGWRLFDKHDKLHKCSEYRLIKDADND